MTDKLMNEFNSATDCEYVYGEATDGSQCKLGKENLSALLKPYFGRIYSGDIIDCDTLTIEGVYGGYRWINAPVVTIAVLEVLPYSRDWILQRFTNISNNETWTRTFVNGDTWTSWKKISFTE